MKHVVPAGELVVFAQKHVVQVRKVVALIVKNVGPVGKLVAFAGKVVVLVQIQKLVALIKNILQVQFGKRVALISK